MGSKKDYNGQINAFQNLKKRRLLKTMQTANATIKTAFAKVGESYNMHKLLYLIQPNVKIY